MATQQGKGKLGLKYLPEEPRGSAVIATGSCEICCLHASTESSIGWKSQVCGQKPHVLARVSKAPWNYCCLRCHGFSPSPLFLPPFPPSFLPSHKIPSSVIHYLGKDTMSFSICKLSTNYTHRCMGSYTYFTDLKAGLGKIVDLGVQEGGHLIKHRLIFMLSALQYPHPGYSLFSLQLEEREPLQKTWKLNTFFCKEKKKKEQTQNTEENKRKATSICSVFVSFSLFSDLFA